MTVKCSSTHSGVDGDRNLAGEAPAFAFRGGDCREHGRVYALRDRGGETEYRREMDILG